MDTSRFKRREIQTRRTNTNRPSEISVPVQRPTALLPKFNAPQLVPVRNDEPYIQAKPVPTPIINTETYPQYPQQPVNNSVPVPAQQVDSANIATPQEQKWQNSIPIDMNLPESEPVAPKKSRFVTTGRVMTGRRLALRGVALCMVLVLLGGGLVFAQGYVKLHKTFKGGAATAAALKVNVNPNLLKGEGDGRVNVLMLGRGGGTHDGPDLTDTMLLASIDPINDTATLLSIPRDLWVDIPSKGAMKINSAWETGEFAYLGSEASGSTNPKAIQAGFNQVDQTVQSVLGVSIDYNVLVNFQAFQQAVNTVGGVTINVPAALVDPTMAWQNNNNPVLANAGIQSFTGSEALNYVRSRETTSDFARAQRQRAVILALENKVETLGILSNPFKISSLFNTFGNNVATDLSLSNATRMFSIVKNIASDKVSSIGLADAPNNYVTTGNLDGQSIDLPSAGLFNYSAIQTFVREQLKDPYILKENAKILVLNGTIEPGLATAMASQLQTYGYNIVGAANTPTSGWSQTQLIDLSNGKDKYTAHYLEQRLKVKAETALPDNAIRANGADFVIIIGGDETTLTQN
jgi:LCP family protein required for cell wall assembly